jgi:Ser-tRNA(Ala) deacylase AlaX
VKLEEVTSLVEILNQRGQRIPTNSRGVMCYPTLNAGRRSFSEWESYKGKVTLPDGRKVPGLVRENTPVVETLKLDPTKFFVNDIMHVLHGGALKMAVYQTFSVELDWDRLYSLKRSPPAQIKIVDSTITALGKFYPFEFSRRPRPISDAKMWKCRETYTTTTVAIPVLKYLGQTRNFVTELGPKFDNLLRLIAASRIVSSHSIRPLTDDAIDLAEKLFSKYVATCIEQDPRSMTTLQHSLLHIADDLRNFKCGASVNAAYKHENAIGIFGENMSRAREPLKQLTTKLARLSTYFTPEIERCLTEDNVTAVPAIPSAAELEKIKELKTIDLPPNSVRHVLRTKIQTKVVCEGFFVSERFPNNFLLVKDRMTRLGVSVVMVTEKAKKNSDGKTIVTGRKFKKVSNYYRISKYEVPYYPYNIYI